MDRTIIEGTKLDYDINLVSLTVDENGTETLDDIVPLSFAGINYLEIADTLPNVGLDGIASINNNYQILDKIGITKLANKTLHLTVDIIDAELFSSSNDKQNSSINFETLLETNSDLGSNIANKTSIFRFEELLSAKLKKATAYDVVRGGVGYGSPLPGQELIRRLLTDWAGKSNRDPQFFLNDSLFVETDDSVLLADIWQIEDSLYDLIYKIHNSFIYGTVDAPLPPLFRLQNTTDDKNTSPRKLTLAPIITDKGREFIQAYTTNNSGDFKDVYQEEFIITGEDDGSGNSSIYNQIEQYTIVKPNYKTLRKEVWGKNLFVESGSVNEPVDLTSTALEFITHSDYVRYFNTGLLGGLDSNIPLIPEADQKVYRHFFGGSSPTDKELVEASVSNRVLKSFIYSNEIIILNVKGEIYRKPGRFITIIDGNGAISDTEDRSTNLWFITEVRHIIKQGSYTNKITAVRILGKTKTPIGNIVNKLVEDFTGVDIAAAASSAVTTVAELPTELPTDSDNSGPSSALFPN